MTRTNVIPRRERLLVVLALVLVILAGLGIGRIASRISMRNNITSGAELSFAQADAQVLSTDALLLDSSLEEENGLHVCVETCGFTPWDRFARLLPYVDLFLYDWKETDPQRHRQYTGADNALIRENLDRLSGAGAEIILRCPIIPGLNDREEHFRGIAELAALEGIIRVDVEPYHEMGRGKAQRAGREYPLAELRAPEDAVKQEWIAAIQRRTQKPVLLA